MSLVISDYMLSQLIARLLDDNSPQDELEQILISAKVINEQGGLVEEFFSQTILDNKVVEES